MSETTKPYNEIDDYIATFSDEERQEYVAAETALDLACILYHIRQEQGLTQRKAAEIFGFFIVHSLMAVINVAPGMNK